MTSLESTGVVRQDRPDEVKTSRSADGPSESQSPVREDSRGQRSSPDPSLATDRYRLTQPYTRDI